MDNNSKSEILLSDIKDYAIIPLGSLDYRRNAFINITNLIWSSSNGLGWALLTRAVLLTGFGFENENEKIISEIQKIIAIWNPIWAIKTTNQSL